jgi:hypothetical protein
MAQHQRKHKRFMRSDRYENKGSYYSAGVKDWSNKFDKDVKSKLQASEIEYKNYKDNNNLIFLQKAGEKLFSAVENHLMIKYNQLHKSHNDIRIMISGNNNDKILFEDADILHKFFYNSDLVISRYGAEVKYRQVLSKLKARM